MVDNCEWKDDVEDLYNALGTKDDRKELDRQFKNEKSNFKIYGSGYVANWLWCTILDTMYIDKPIQRHNLIQTISESTENLKEKRKD
jgi:type I restriction enzyme R subunit